jgi:deoxyhypusine synthase
MNAIKSIINHTTVTTLNLASNMISQAGLEMILDDLMKNNVLKSLDVFFFIFFSKINIFP